MKSLVTGVVVNPAAQFVKQPDFERKALTAAVAMGSPVLYFCGNTNVKGLVF